MRDHLLQIDFGYRIEFANRRAEFLRGRTTVCVQEVDPSELRMAWRVSESDSGKPLFDVFTYGGSFWWPALYDGLWLAQEEFVRQLSEPGSDIVRVLGAPECEERFQTLEDYLTSQPRKIRKFNISDHDKFLAKLSRGAAWTLFSGGQVFFKSGAPALYYLPKDSSSVFGATAIREGEWGIFGIGRCGIPGPTLIEREASARKGLAFGPEELQLDFLGIPGVMSQRIDGFGDPPRPGSAAQFCEWEFFESLMPYSSDRSWGVEEKIRALKKWREDLLDELALAQDCRTTVRCYAEMYDGALSGRDQNAIRIARFIRRRLAALDLIHEFTEEDECCLIETASATSHVA